jgi:nucleoside-diphosphate-sugar epimerase
MATWVILGCGYVGTRLARALIADGHEVRAAARNLARLQPLAELGVQLHQIEASKRRTFGPVLYGAHDLIVVYSIPPVPGSPPGSTIARAAEAAQAAGARCFVYLGSTAVYGETPSGEVVDEDSPLAIGDSEAAPRIAEESAVDTARLAGLHTVILRLAAIYGPGRGVRERLKKGDYQLIDDGVHYYSRVHVDDLVGIIRAAVEHAPPGARYCVGDDRPATQREYAEWLAARLGLPLPPSVASLAPGKRRRPVRNRKIDNRRLHAELRYTFRYPSYVEGELAIEAEAGLSPSAPPTPAPTPSPSVDAARLARVDELVRALEGAIEGLSQDEREAVGATLARLRAKLA